MLSTGISTLCITIIPTNATLLNLISLNRVFSKSVWKINIQKTKINYTALNFDLIWKKLSFHIKVQFTTDGRPFRLLKSLNIQVTIMMMMMIIIIKITALDSGHLSICSSVLIAWDNQRCVKIYLLKIQLTRRLEKQTSKENNNKELWLNPFLLSLKSRRDEILIHHKFEWAWPIFSIFVQVL